MSEVWLARFLLRVTTSAFIRWSAKRRLADPEGYAAWVATEPRRKKSYTLRKRYGIDLAEYERLLAEQGGVCKVCHQPPFDGQCLHVDHDHETGQVRSLLCARCNWFIGSIENGLLPLALAYLGRR